MDSVGDGEYGDYWEYFPHRGLLRRHHVNPRQELFGHLPSSRGPWEVAPVEKERLLVRRRTTILTLNQISDVFHIHDGWNFDQPEDQRRPTVCDEPWVGFTDFALPGGEPLEFLPPFDPHSMLSEPGSDDEAGEDDQDEDDGEGPSTGGSTTPQTSQEAEAPQSIEDDDRGSWLTCGTTMCGPGGAGQGREGSPSSSERSDEKVEPRPSLKVFLHRRDGRGDGEEREDRRRERSRSRDDEDVRPEAEQSRDEVPSSEDAGGRASSSRGDGGVGIGSAERTRRNVETADLEDSIPPDDMVHVPAEWVEGIGDSIEDLLDAERLPEENQRRRAQRNDVVRRALQRLGVLQENDRREREGDDHREREGDDRREREGDDRREREGGEVPYNPNYMDEIMAAERDEMEESLEDLIRRGLVSVETAERVRNTADIVSQGGRCPAATLEAVDLNPREGIARMDIVVRGPVQGHAAYHVMGQVRTDVSRCIHNNPDVEVVGGLPPHMVAQPEEVHRQTEEVEGPWNAEDGWDGSTVETMSPQEAQRIARQACLQFAEYQMFKRRAQHCRDKYVRTMARLGIEITEANEATNPLIQSQALRQEEQEWESQVEDLEEESNVTWDPEVDRQEHEGGGAPRGSGRPSMRKMRIQEASDSRTKSSPGGRSSFSTTRATTGLIGWGVVACLTDPVMGQPEEDPGGQGLFWMMSAAMVFSYTVIVVILSGFCFWWWNRETRQWNYARDGDDSVPDRLWRWTEADGAAGGIWDGISGEWIPYDQGSGSSGSGQPTESEGESAGGFPPPFGRGAHLQRQYVFRPGQGRTREPPPLNPNVEQRPRRMSMPTPRFGMQSQVPSEPSSEAYQASESEMSGSFDEQGRFHVRQRRSERTTDETGGTMPSTTASTLEGGGGATSLPSSSSGQSGSTFLRGSSSMPMSSTIQEEPEVEDTVGGEGEVTLEHPIQQGGPPQENVSQSRPSDTSMALAAEFPEASFEVYYTQYGEVYHKRRNCGKLRCAKRILRSSNCPACANAPLGGERLLLDRTSYHLSGGPCNSSVVNILRPCAECGG